MKTAGIETGHALGGLLRFWRQSRGKSQLDLALDAGVSQRHVSFVESGRSIPSRGLLLTLARTPDIPLREQNAVLLAAGYAPVYAEMEWDAPGMAMVKSAIDRMLAQHEPHPALVMDRYWNVLETNDASPRFFGKFVDLSLRPKPRNMLHLMFDPQGLRPFLENWEQVAASLLQRVRREALGHVVDAKTAALLEELKCYPGVKDLNMGDTSLVPVVPMIFAKDGERFPYFSMITTVGTPQCLTAQEFRVECLFPAEA